MAVAVDKKKDKKKDKRTRVYKRKPISDEKPKTLAERRRIMKKKELPALKKKSAFLKSIEDEKRQLKKQIEEAEKTKKELEKQRKKRVETVKDLRMQNPELTEMQFKKLVKKELDLDEDEYEMPFTAKQLKQFQKEKMEKEGKKSTEVSKKLEEREKAKLEKQRKKAAEAISSAAIATKQALEASQIREKLRKEQMQAVMPEESLTEQQKQLIESAEKVSKSKMAEKKTMTEAKIRAEANKLRNKIDAISEKIAKYRDEYDELEAKPNLSRKEKTLKRNRLKQIQEQNTQLDKKVDELKSLMAQISGEAEMPPLDVNVPLIEEEEEPEPEQQMQQNLDAPPEIVVQQPEEENVQNAEAHAENPPPQMQELAQQPADEAAAGLQKQPIIGLGLAQKYGIHPNHIKEGKNTYTFTKRGKEHIKALKTLLNPTHAEYVINWSLLNKARNDRQKLTKPKSAKSVKGGGLDIWDRLMYWIGSKFTPMGLLTQGRSYDESKKLREQAQAKNVA